MFPHAQDMRPVSSSFFSSFARCSRMHMHMTLVFCLCLMPHVCLMFAHAQGHIPRNVCGSSREPPPRALQRSNTTRHRLGIMVSAVSAAIVAEEQVADLLSLSIGRLFLLRRTSCRLS